MAKVRRLPLATYQNGTREFGPWAFPNGLEGFDIRVGRCTTATPTIWPNENTRVSFVVEFSFDGGQTYPHRESWTPQGGGIKSKNGVELAEESVSWRFEVAGEDGQPVAYEPTHAKATVTVTGGPIRTYCDVTVR